MDLSKIPIDIKFAFSHNTDYKIEDVRVFPAMTNKIEIIGKIRPRKFLVQCDGNGTLTFKEINSAYERLKQLKKLLDEHLISEGEYEEKKKVILEEI